MLQYLFSPQILVVLVSIVIGYALFRTILNKLLPRWLVWGVAILIITGIIPFSLVARTLSATVGYVATTSVRAVVNSDSTVNVVAPPVAGTTDPTISGLSVSTATRVLEAILGTTHQASSNWAQAAH